MQTKARLFGELVELLPGFRPQSMPIHLVYPSSRLLPSRVKVVLEALGALRGRSASEAGRN